MTTLNSLWLSAAVWLLAVSAFAVLFDVSTWGGGLTLGLVGAVPIVIARRFWKVPEQSLSQQIQRELR